MSTFLRFVGVNENLCLYYHIAENNIWQELLLTNIIQKAAKHVCFLNNSKKEPRRIYV